MMPVGVETRSRKIRRLQEEATKKPLPPASSLAKKAASNAPPSSSQGAASVSSPVSALKSSCTVSVQASSSAGGAAVLPRLIMRVEPPPSYRNSALRNERAIDNIKSTSQSGAGSIKVKEEIISVPPKSNITSPDKLNNSFIIKLEPEEEVKFVACRSVRSSHGLRRLAVPCYKEVEYLPPPPSLPSKKKGRTVAKQQLTSNATDECAPISQLPDEILGLIFSHIPELDLPKVIAPVCRRWHAISKNPCLWRALSFVGPKVPFSVISEILKKSPLLKTITLKDRKDVDQLLPVLYQNCKRMRNINLVRCSTSLPQQKSIPAKFMLQMIKNGQNLRTLNLKGTLFRSRKFYQDLSLLPNLTALNLGCSRGISYQMVEDIAKCSNLTVFKHKWHTRAEYAGSPSTALRGKSALWANAYSLIFEKVGPQLSVLELDIWCLKDHKLGEGLSHCKNLKKLILYNAVGLGAQGMAAVSYMSNMTQLHIHKGSSLMSPSVTSETFQKGNLSNLRILHFYECTLRSGSSVSVDQCVEVVAKSCPKLRHLSLAKCRYLTDAGVLAVLKNCSKLRSLDLYGTLGVEGVSFLSIPECTPSLDLLIVEDDCDTVKSENRQKLLQLFPNVQIKSSSSWKYHPYSHLQ